MAETKDNIAQADQLAADLHKTLVDLISSSNDLDIQRILKRSEAEIMDLRHNLSLVRRLKGE